MKKSLSIFLMAFILIGIIGLIPSTAATINPLQDLAEIVTIINNYNQAHSGTLTARLEPTEWGTTIIVVTGEVSNATTGLTLPWQETSLMWQANISGNPSGGESLLRFLGWSGISNAVIETNGRAIEGNLFEITDATITGIIYIGADPIQITNSVITSNITLENDASLALVDSVFHGSLIFNGESQSLFIANSEANITYIAGNGIDLTIYENAHVYVDCVDNLTNIFFQKHSSAVVDFEDRLNNFIRSDEGGLTVVGNVTLNSLSLTEWAGRLLYIPVGASLSLNQLQLGGGVILIIDGTLNLPANFDFSAWNGVVMGDNAGNLLGTWENGVRTPPSGAPCSRWYNRMPVWLHWVFRNIFFGWAWMCC